MAGKPSESKQTEGQKPSEHGQEDFVPVVYLLCGEDDFAIAEFINRLMNKLGDKSMAEMNTTHLDGRACSFDELVSTVSAMPFLAKRRLVILTHAMDCGKSSEQQKRFLDILNKVPATTALVLVVESSRSSESDRKKNKPNWLEIWAGEAQGHAVLRYFQVPEGPSLNDWIRNRTKAAGGQITSQAADELAGRVGLEPRLLDQEIKKLLAFANYSRPVDVDDVQYLTPDIAGAQNFALINAIRAHDTKKALKILERELIKTDPIPIFQRIVSQFRQLLQVREVLDDGGREEDVARLLRMHPYAARLAAEHAKNFTLAALEKIYFRLLAVDELMKTSGMEGDLALEVLVTELSA